MAHTLATPGPVTPDRDQPAPGADFASALRAAVEDSGLGLESIQRRLAARSVDVSVSTLSYWQNGVRSPGRRRSEEVVAHLESVLGLEPRSLRVLIPPPRPRGRRAVVPPPQLPRAIAAIDPMRCVAEKVAPGYDLARISHHDVLTIGADRRITCLRSQRLLRAEAVGVHSIGFTHHFEDATAGQPRVDLLTGGMVVAEHVDRDHRVIAVEVDFGRVLERGETVLLEFELRSDGPGPADRTYEFSHAVDVRELTVQVRFDPADPPAWCESFQRVDTDGDEVRRRVEVASFGHAHTVALDRPSGSVGLAWDWA